MLPVHQIKREYRTFLERREDMTRAYTKQLPPAVDVQCAASVPPDDAPPAAPSAARAPASLTW
jgi:hypothetical protein